MQPWTPLPDENSHESWEASTDGHRDPNLWDSGLPDPGLPDPELYDRPTNSLRRPDGHAYQIEEPSAYGVQQRSGSLYGQPVAQPMEQPGEQPGEQPVDQPTAQPLAQPVEQPLEQPRSRVYGRAASPSAPDGLSPHAESLHGAPPASQFLPAAAGSAPVVGTASIPGAPAPRRRRAWDDEEAWRPGPPATNEWAGAGAQWTQRPTRASRRASSAVEAEPRQVASGVYATGQPAAVHVPIQQHGSGEYPTSAPQVPQSTAPPAKPSQLKVLRGRRFEIRSRSGRSRHERAHSSKRALRFMVASGLLLVAGIGSAGYWLLGLGESEPTPAASMPGVTLVGLMGKVKSEGFTCLAPGATIARCTKQVAGVEFSVTLKFVDESQVNGIFANGGTGVQSASKVTDSELRKFFAMASQLPFASATPEAQSWVDNNLRKDAKGDVAGVGYETSSNQDVLSIFAKKSSES